MDAVSIKSSALSELGGTEFQVKPDLSVVYFDGNATEPTESDINDKLDDLSERIDELFTEIEGLKSEKN